MGEFKDYFTPSAQGGSGRPRNLTEVDIRILHFIDQMKKESAPADEIHTALRHMRGKGWQGLPDIPVAPENMANVPVVPTAAADVALSTERRGLMREITILQERLSQLEDRLEAKDEDILELTRQLSAAETELHLYRTGRLKPDES
jgi:DNA-binding transcriptional MerR regulator